jgi:hypothetical protein
VVKGPSHRWRLVRHADHFEHFAALCANDVSLSWASTRVSISLSLGVRTVEHLTFCKIKVSHAWKIDRCLDMLRSVVEIWW